MHYGIDVSSNNAHPIDYAAAVAALRQMGNGAQPFVIVKATQGSWYVNPDFAADVAGFKAAGAAVGAYLMDEGNADVATEEAFYRRVAGPIPQYDDDELPMGNSDYVAHCAALVAQNPKASDYLNQSEEDEGFPPGAGIWEANYNNQPGVTHRPGVLIHQYSDVGRVAGIQGDVDLNVFLGTETQFAEMFAYVKGDPSVPTLNAPIVDVVMRPQNDGYWLIAQDGGVFAFGAAKAFTDPAVGKLTSGHYVRAAASTPTGLGLVVVASDGGVFCLGDAQYHGSIPALSIGPSTTPLEA